MKGGKLEDELVLVFEKGLLVLVGTFVDGVPVDYMEYCYDRSTEPAKITDVEFHWQDQKDAGVMRSQKFEYRDVTEKVRKKYFKRVRAIYGKAQGMAGIKCVEFDERFLVEKIGT